MWSLHNLHVDRTESTTHLCELLPGKTHRDEIICLSSPRRGPRRELLSRSSAVAVLWQADRPGVSTCNQGVSLQEAWVVLRVQLTSLHLGFPLLANPVSRCTEFYLTPSCFFGASPIPTRWADSARCSPSHTLLRRSSWKFPFTVLSPLHTLCASFPSAGLASACTASTVPLCKIPSSKSDRMAHVVYSARKNDVEKPLCLSRFWTYHIYPNWQNAAQVTRKRKQGREICL